MITDNISIILCVLIICATYLIKTGIEKQLTTIFRWKKIVVKLRKELEQRNIVIEDYHKQWLADLVRREGKLEKSCELHYEFWKKKFEELKK